MVIGPRGEPGLAVDDGIGEPRWLSLDDLRSLPLAETGSVVAGPAVTLDSLLPARTRADHVTVESGDGHYRASIPLDDVRRGGLLLVDVPRDRGGPLRAVVVDGRTLCWNVKDVVRLRLTRGATPDSVPDNPPH